MEVVLRAQSGHLGKWVFRGLKGSHLQAVTVQIWWADLMRTLKIEDLIIHDLRRTFQTCGVELGFPPGDMDVLVGHKLPGMQATYVHLSPGGILAQASAVTSAWMAAALDGKSPRIGERIGGLVERKA
jgi:integrase